MNAILELEVQAPADADRAVSEICELSELQLACIGGGVGEVIVG